ncbi:MAG: type III pantothenate kinase [candidate division Zixibacteria bacterium]|nr:type III pantothenate kinase [candidate division Zixibacteria bacterium]
MLVTIDIGNTNTVVGLYAGNELRNFYRLSSRDSITVDEAGLLLFDLCRLNNAPEEIDGAAMCSVVPILTSRFEAALKKYFNSEPLILDHKTDTGMKIDYEIPNQVGSDRIADAVAAYNKYGGPTIIVDLGTAVTVDAVSSDGVYLGGAIAPGIEASVAGLSKRASQLFQVSLHPPSRTLGKNTMESIQAGIIFGAVGQIDALVKRISSEIGEDVKMVVATGGLADMVKGLSETVREVDHTLTLDGLKFVYNRIKNK